MAIEDREVNERFLQSTIVERDGRNYWKVSQIYGGHLVGSWTLHTPVGGVMLDGNRMLDLATGLIFIYKRKGKLVLHSKGIGTNAIIAIIANILKILRILDEEWDNFLFVIWQFV